MDGMKNTPAQKEIHQSVLDLKASMEACGLNPFALAKISGVNDENIYRWFSGKATPSVPLFQDVKIALEKYREDTPQPDSTENA